MRTTPANVAHLRVMMFIYFPLGETHCRHCGESQSPHEKQDEHDDQNDTDDATGTVAPALGVRPGGQDADEHQDEDDQQNGAKTHDLLLFSPPPIFGTIADAPGSIPNELPTGGMEEG
jgi:hypothetical protein